MSSDETYKQIADEVDELMWQFTEEELNKRFLKNHGCLNLKSEEYLHEVDLAREYHKRQKVLQPEAHDEQEIEPYRCYHQTICKCGFSEACDSSD